MASPHVLRVLAELATGVNNATGRPRRLISKTFPACSTSSSLSLKVRAASVAVMRMRRSTPLVYLII
jgi:hypothetical protein